MPCLATTLLSPNAGAALQGAILRYPAHYDEVLHDVHSRLVAHGAATKLDLAALIGWKHVRNAPWMHTLLSMPDVLVRSVTAESFQQGLTDDQRVGILGRLPGFGSGGAFTSVLLAAWDPSAYGVFDKNVFNQ